MAAVIAAAGGGAAGAAAGAALAGPPVFPEPTTNGAGELTDPPHERGRAPQPLDPLGGGGRSWRC